MNQDINIQSTTAPIKDSDGQLSVDIYNLDSTLHIVAPIAGVQQKDISISLSEEVLVIKGTRLQPTAPKDQDYFTQECFWGPFSRSIILPKQSETTKIKATFKNHILTITIPQNPEKQDKIIKIQES